MPRPSLLRLLLLAVSVVTVSTQAVFLVGASFFQIGPELGLGPLGLGLLTAAFFLTASVSSPILGRWVQRVGWQRALVVNARITAAVLIAIPLLARNIWSLAALLVLAGSVYGASNPAANQALADHTQLRRQATIFGAKHAGIPASTLVAGLGVPLIVENFGWRWSYVVAALLATSVSLAVPRGELPAPVASPLQRGTPAPRTSTRDLVMLAGGSAFATAGAVALGTYLVSASVHVGFSASAAGTIQFVGSAASIGARMLAGAVTDRRGSSGVSEIVLLASVGAVAFALLSVTSGAAYVLLVVVAFATGWGWPGLMTYTVVRANRASVASASSITQAGVFVGAGGIPILLGAVIERWSFGGAWLLTAGSLVLAAIVIAVVGRRMAGPSDAVRSR